MPIIPYCVTWLRYWDVDFIFNCFNYMVTDMINHLQTAIDNLFLVQLHLNCDSGLDKEILKAIHQIDKCYAEVKRIEIAIAYNSIVNTYLDFI